MKSTPILAALMLSAAWPAWAGEGHDHGDAPAAMAGPALPRFTAVSELFELVGVLDDHPPVGPQQSRRDPLHLAQVVQPVRPRVQGQGWVVARHLGVARHRVGGDVGRVRHN